MKILLPPAILAVLIICFLSCKKESFITSPDARLSISVDSVKFDTVFTSTGSITQSFKIFNDNEQRLKLSSIRLMGGAASAFKINVNGIAATEVSNIDIAANDSIYIFVSVTVNPNAASLAFILSDSISVNYNGNTRFVQLQAYGQNANFLNNITIRSNTSFNNVLPYVVLGGLTIAPDVTLTIPAGTKIYAHADAPVIVDGTLLVNGTKDEPVTFTGDRLDAPYNVLPAGWPGIYFRATSKDSKLTFASIKNAYQAIVVLSPATTSAPKLILQQCIIDNAYDIGLLCYNTSVQADNSLISNCGTNIAIQLGGNYSFTHCTVATVSSKYLLHTLPVLSAANFAEINGSTLTADLNAVFKNCIFWGENGSVEDELNIQKQGTSIFNVILDHCIYKTETEPANTSFLSSIKNQDPQFDSIDVRNEYYDFRVTKFLFAPGIDAGFPTGLAKDLDDQNRNNGLPDIGAYEKQ